MSTLTITAADLRLGRPGASTCPLALAARRLPGITGGVVVALDRDGRDEGWIWAGDRKIPLPPDAVRWARKHDRGEGAGPATFAVGEIDAKGRE